MINFNSSTLKSDGVDRQQGFNEILNSPVFKILLLANGKTSGVIVYIKEKKLSHFLKIKGKRYLQR